MAGIFDTIKTTFTNIANKAEGFKAKVAVMKQNADQMVADNHKPSLPDALAATFYDMGDKIQASAAINDGIDANVKSFMKETGLKSSRGAGKGGRQF